MLVSSLLSTPTALLLWLGASPLLVSAVVQTSAPTGVCTETPTRTIVRRTTPSPTSGTPTSTPTAKPSQSPTKRPSPGPTNKPTNKPTHDPSPGPTNMPTNNPTSRPTDDPTSRPTPNPTNDPSESPTKQPTPAPVVVAPRGNPGGPTCPGSPVTQPDITVDDWNNPPWACPGPAAAVICTNTNDQDNSLMDKDRNEIVVGSLTCKTASQGNSGDIVTLTVTQVHYNTETPAEIIGVTMEVSGGDYYMSAVYVKAANEGQAYFFGDNRLSNRGREGGSTGTFYSPHNGAHEISHITMCVIHKDEMSNCLPEGSCPATTFDFNDLAWGMYLKDQYKDTHGITFEAWSNCWTPTIDGEHDLAWGSVRVFDTYRPDFTHGGSEMCNNTYGNGDDDLGSPNQNCDKDAILTTYGSPPDGAAEWRLPGIGTPHPGYENCEPQGMVAIIQESKKQCPDDCGGGGKIRVQWPIGDGVTLESINILDIDEPQNGKLAPLIDVYDKDDVLVYSSRANATDENGLAIIDINKDNVRKLEVDYDGSGSLGELRYIFCPEPEPEPQTTHDCPPGFNLLKTWDLMTLDDFSSNSDVEGSAFIGGSIVGTSPINFGMQLQSTNDVVLTVNGPIDSSLTSTLKVLKGHMSHPGFYTYSESNMNWVVDGRKVEIHEHSLGRTVIADGTIPSRASEYKKQLEELSEFFRDLPETPNCGIEIPPLPSNPGQPGPCTININQVDSDNVAVVNIDDATTIFANNKVQQFEIKPNGCNPELVVINVKGKIVEFTTSFNMIGSWLTGVGESKTVWNFYEAEVLNTGSQRVGGIVLAPLAHMSIGNPIDGATFVKSLDATSEIHLPVLSSTCPFGNGVVGNGVTTSPTKAPTPEPTASPTQQPVPPAPSACVLPQGIGQVRFHSLSSPNSNSWLSRSGDETYSGSGQWIPSPRINVYGYQQYWGSMKWTLEEQSSGVYKIKNGWTNGNDYLTVTGTSLTMSSTGSLFTFEYMFSGYYKVICNGLVLEHSGWNVFMADYCGAGTQLWQIEDLLQSSILPPTTLVDEHFFTTGSTTGTSYNHYDYSGLWTCQQTDADCDYSHSWSDIGYRGAMRLRDNGQSRSSMKSTAISVSGKDELKITFSFKTLGFSSYEDFMLDYSYNGSYFYNKQTWKQGTHFWNGNEYTFNVHLDVSNCDHIYLRFRCDASWDNDKLYIFYTKIELP